MGRQLEFFHQNRVDLQKEVNRHPELLQILEEQEYRGKEDDWEVQLAEIATYCEVMLDGNYMPHELDHLCGILYKKLIEKRVPIILS